MTAVAETAGYLIAEVAALAGVSITRLRSWERAGLLHPRRATSNGVRLYGVEDIARARLIARSQTNPGRRGSLFRLVDRLAGGDLRPEAQDYAGLAVDDAGRTGATVPDAAAGPSGPPWRAILDAMTDLVAIADADGRVIHLNPALDAAIRRSSPRSGAARSVPPDIAGVADALFVASGLSLRWSARTGVSQADLRVVLRHADGSERPTLWRVDPLPGVAGGRGAIAVGRDRPPEGGSNQDQGDWLAAAAHDLRSAATTIVGHTQLARRISAAGWREASDPGGKPSPPAMPSLPPRLLRHLDGAERGAREMVRAMETLLDASAIAAGVLIGRLDAGGVDLDGPAREAVAHARGMTTRHAVALTVPEAPLRVAGDRARLRQVLDHLLANAVKYSPDGGPIAVSLAAAPTLPPDPPPDGEARWALVRVADAGIGIPGHDLPRVFDRSRRAPGAARLVRGAGLGLYTCRAIVVAHGGHIWVERTAVAA